MAEGEESFRRVAVLSWMKSYDTFAAAAAAGLDDSHDDQTEISVVVVVEAGHGLNKSLEAEDETTTKRTPCYHLYLKSSQTSDSREDFCCWFS